MKTRTKALLLTLCAALLVCATVLATMAFLTAKDAVTNTFTVGNVAITLDEAKVDVYGEAATPGVVLTKTHTSSSPVMNIRRILRSMLPRTARTAGCL